MQGGFLFLCRVESYKIGKRVVMFIREMRVPGPDILLFVSNLSQNFYQRDLLTTTISPYFCAKRYDYSGLYVEKKYQSVTTLY